MTEPFDPTRVEALLFDVDGTLADTDDAWVQRLAGGLSPLQRLWPTVKPVRWARRFIMAAETPLNSLYAWWDRLYLDEIAAPLVRLLPRLRSPKRGNVPLVPGVRELLARTRGAYRLAVVTARGRRGAQALLMGMGLEDAFDLVVTTRSAQRAKPHPAPILWAAEQLGLRPEACLMIGDTTLDVRAGRQAGAQTAAVLCGFGEREELLEAGPHLLLESTADLLDHLPVQPWPPALPH